MQMKLRRFMIDHRAKIRYFPGFTHLCLRRNTLYFFRIELKISSICVRQWKTGGLISEAVPPLRPVPKQSRPKQMHSSIWHLPTFLTLMKAKLLALLHIFKLRKACVKSEALLWGAYARVSYLLPSWRIEHQRFLCGFKMRLRKFEMKICLL